MKKNFWKILCGISLAVISNFAVHASTSLTVGGHAGTVGQYLHGMPPSSLTYGAFQVPVGLIFQANPSDDFSLFLELDYAYSNYPVPTILLGETSTVTTGNSNGNLIPMPFANGVGPGFPFGQKVDIVQLIQAYFAYQTPFGLFRAGRMPRNWGLGLWYNSNWTAEGSGISTTDALAFTTDFGLFEVSVYYEKYGQSIQGYFNTGSATGYTVEGRLKTSAIDLPSVGVSRDVGIIYSKFIHQQSSTELNILDVYGKFYFPRFFLGSEILFPSGNTKNPNYQTLGGAPECSVPTGATTTCSSQTVTSLGAMLKLKARLDSPAKTNSLYALERSQALLGTAERQTSHTGELWVGFASGGRNQFETTVNPINNTISAIRLNPNILPSLLMFTNTTPLINGMPTASITNSTFVRVGYTYEAKGIGAFTPVLVWGMINFTNPNFSATNALCTSTPPTNNATSLNAFCVGNSRNLGTELDISYSYTTTHLIKAQLDLGYWLVGDAWKRFGQHLPYSTFGVRGILSTQF